MNHLAHFFLSYPDTDLMTGGFLGDFVKGRLTGELPDGLEQGIRLHRAIDAFTDQHPTVKQSQLRFDAEFRRYAAIICDIAYDHLLAKNWHKFADVSLETFCNHAYRVVVAAERHLPETALLSIRRMQSHGALESYRQEKFVDLALTSISSRLSRPNPLASGYAQFQNNKTDLQADFEQFMPLINRFVSDWMGHQTKPPQAWP